MGVTLRQECGDLHAGAHSGPFHIFHAEPPLSFQRAGSARKGQGHTTLFSLYKLLEKGKGRPDESSLLRQNASRMFDEEAAAVRVQKVERGRQQRKKMSLKTIARAVAPPKREMPKPVMRTLVTRLVEVNRLWDIDIIGQRFKAEFVVQLAFEGSAKDKDLNKLSDASFPLDGFGRPTFRPSAAWYMAQVDFNNALEYRTLDKNIFISENDIVMTLRFEGTFSEVMELENYPCDVQELTMSLAFNTRTTGMMPLEIINSPKLSTGVVSEGFVDGKLWDLHNELDVRPGTTGNTADRLFPALEMVCLVGRQPWFVIFNVALPVFFFVPMAILQFAVPRYMTADRLSVSLAIVLTTIAHKYSMSTLVPQLSYLTFLDKYVLASTMLIILITFEGAALGMVETVYCRLQAYYVDPDGDEVGEDRGPNAVRYRLLVAKAAAQTSSDGVDLSEDSFGYLDTEICPPRSVGPLGVFDYIDFGCFCANWLAWLLIQLWALRRFLKERGTFKRQVTTIEKHKEEALAEVQRRKRQALGKLNTSLKVAAASVNMQKRRSKALSGADGPAAVLASQGGAGPEGARHPALPRLKTFANLPARKVPDTPVAAGFENSQDGEPIQPGPPASTVPGKSSKYEAPPESAPHTPVTPTGAGSPTSHSARQLILDKASAAQRGARPRVLQPLESRERSGSLVENTGHVRQGQLSPRNLAARSRWQLAGSATGIAASCGRPARLAPSLGAVVGTSKVAPSPQPTRESE